jgi:AcrR family transcriptional regulator
MQTPWPVTWPTSRRTSWHTAPVSKPTLSRPKVPRVSGHSRRQYSSTTRRKLVQVAEEMFTENGYAATSLDSIVAGTRVTKGALYHHFGGKQDLFESVFENVEERAAKAIRKALKAEKDPWEKALAGLRGFLEVVQTPEYRRIVMQEGPAVMGYTRFREQEERSTFNLVGEIVRSVLDQRRWDFDEDMVETFTQIFFGAMSAAGESVSESSDPIAASARVEAAIGFILAGLRSVMDAADPVSPPASG